MPTSGDGIGLLPGSVDRVRFTRPTGCRTRVAVLGEKVDPRLPGGGMQPEAMDEDNGGTDFGHGGIPSTNEIGVGRKLAALGAFRASVNRLILRARQARQSPVRRCAVNRRTHPGLTGYYGRWPWEKCERWSPTSAAVPSNCAWRLCLARSPDPGEVLVEVHAAAITFAELGWPESWTHRPMIPSHEMSGVVAACGEGVTGLADGDQVFGSDPLRSAGSGRRVRDAHPLTTWPAGRARFPMSSRRRCRSPA